VGIVAKFGSELVSGHSGQFFGDGRFWAGGLKSVAEFFAHVELLFCGGRPNAVWTGLVAMCVDVQSGLTY
jgi:hypothetical protein